MSTIVTRSGKGSELSHTEADANFTNLNTDKLESILTDTTPQLGGSLDVNGQNIVSASNGNIAIVPNGSGNISLTPTSGNITLGATNFPTTDGSANQWITTTGSGTLAFTSNLYDATLKDYKETIHDLGTTDAPSFTVSNGNVQKVTFTGSALALSAFSDGAAGQSVTVFATGTGNATGTGAYKFAGGTKTLTAFSVISIFYDGTTYWASIATDFKA